MDVRPTNRAKPFEKGQTASRSNAKKTMWSGGISPLQGGSSTGAGSDFTIALIATVFAADARLRGGLLVPPNVVLGPPLG